MILLFLLCCIFHKTSLTGVIDDIDHDQCNIEVSSGDIISVSSSKCKRAKEGEKIIFYIK